MIYLLLIVVVMAIGGGIGWYLWRRTGDDENLLGSLFVAGIVSVVISVAGILLFVGHRYDTRFRHRVDRKYAVNVTGTNKHHTSIVFVRDGHVCYADMDEKLPLTINTSTIQCDVDRNAQAELNRSLETKLPPKG